MKTSVLTMRPLSIHLAVISDEETESEPQRLSQEMQALEGGTNELLPSDNDDVNVGELQPNKVLKII